ncbi:MAG: YetF domain-containing protein [Pontixanthobacter sp.]
MNPDPIWFSNWSNLAEITLSSILFFALIVVLTLVSGKRTTSQMNNFDWILTVAVGSLAASGILLETVAIVDAIMAILVIVACQYLLTWLAVRSDTVTKIIKDEPTLLVNKGEYIDEAMLRTRVTQAEINAALRENGLTKLEDANWVILETEGTLSVVPKQDIGWKDAKMMQNVQAPEKVGS